MWMVDSPAWAAGRSSSEADLEGAGHSRAEEAVSSGQDRVSRGSHPGIDIVVVPPAGGTYRSGNGVLTAVGVVALIGAAYSMRQAVRRRRAAAGNGAGDSSPGRDG